MRTIEYCKVRLNVTPWIKQGIHFFHHLPDTQKTNFSGKLNSKPHLKKFNPNRTMEIPKVIWNFFTSSEINNKRGISLFYKLIFSFPPNTKTSNMLKWESDLSQSFSWETWYKAIRINNSASSCMEHWENSQKNTKSLVFNTIQAFQNVPIFILPMLEM